MPRAKSTGRRLRRTKENRKIKRNFPFAKNSSPRMFCKNCGGYI